MRDERTGNWITFNGEVFNFREVRRTLEEQQLAFRSETDTEVLLKGLGLRGLDAVHSWRGMFALGWWEPQAERLTLIRDRLGIKPLYYYYDSTSFIFASEVRALLATGLVPRRLSRAAVESYLAYGAVQQPLTIIENVYAVLPGHALIFEGGSLRTQAYWQLHAAPASSPITDVRELTEELGALLAESVRLRMVADVPVAAFLSGGVDSSAVVSLMRRTTSGAIKTFCIHFNEQSFSEQTHAARVAEQFDTEHHPILLTEQSVLDKLPQALAALDQPSVDGVNTYVVSEAVAQCGVKVALSGLGGDEVFAGYSFFRTIAGDEQRRLRVAGLPFGVRRHAGTVIASLGRSARLTKLGELLRSHALDAHAVFLHRRLFASSQQHELLTPNGGVATQCARDCELLQKWQASLLANCAQADPINQASVLDLGGYLANTLLRDTDAMSMAHGLEARVPLIDHKLVERMLAIPGAVKLHPTLPKHLLVKAVGDLPHEIVERPKQGFELPFQRWLRGGWREHVEAALHQPQLDGLLRPAATRQLWRDFVVGRVNWARVWSLYVLNEWAALHT